MHLNWIYTVFIATLLVGLIACSEPSKPEPSITLEKAIAIAYQNVPSSVSGRAHLYVWWTPKLGPNGTWKMEFHDANITQADLGWIDNPSGTPQVLLDNNLSIGVPTTYQILMIDIDGNNGKVLLKMATYVIGPLDSPPPPLTVVPPPKS